MIYTSIVLYKHTYEELEPTLRSLFNTTLVEKVVLVDNDNSEWASSFDHSKVIYLKSAGNFGFGYGHNLAINKYAEFCDFFLICNPDIVFEEAQLNQLVEFASKREEGLFLPKIIYPNGINQYGARLLPTPLNLFARRFSPLLAEKLDQTYLLKNLNITKPSFSPNLSGCFMLFKSKCLLSLGGFDERFFMYLEDIDLSRRCAEKYGTLYYPLVTVIHNHEQASYKNTKLLRAHLKSALQYFNKWGWIYDSGRRALNSRCLLQIKIIE